MTARRQSGRYREQTGEPSQPLPQPDYVSPFALALAQRPSHVSTLRGLHVADPDGYCHLCRFHRAAGVGAAGRWPCMIRRYADEAWRWLGLSPAPPRPGARPAS